MVEDPRFPFDKPTIRRMAEEWRSGWYATDASLNEWVDAHGHCPGTLVWDIERLKFYWMRDVMTPLLNRLTRFLSRRPAA